ncbi:MAG: penicillin acylase family protein [bacterium]
MSLRTLLCFLAALAAAGCSYHIPARTPITAPEAPPVHRVSWSEDDYRGIAARVEVRRTDYGVPHILAEDLQALGFGIAWCQAEDYGPRAVEDLVEARGRAAWVFGDSSRTGGDAFARLRWEGAVDTYHLLPSDVRSLMEGFAAGMNHYMDRHPGEFEAWRRIRFTGHDVSALTVGSWSLSSARRFARYMQGRTAAGGGPPEGTSAPPHPDPHPDDGSNVWALDGSRTASRRPILLRNPHLSWSAGYYEAHLTVPGVVDFYGDIRIGGAFGIIGGFNRRLGWSTTNNGPDLDMVYALERDDDRPERVLFDGASLPVTARAVRVPWRTDDGREGWTQVSFPGSPVGPIIHQDAAHFYVLRDAADGQFRRGEQYLRMMQASDLEEWFAAMRIQAIQSSNYTYADADGNIVYLWNARLPSLPHPVPGSDREALPARGSDDIWTGIEPLERLPRLVNPPGGYLQNANDPPDFTNLNVDLDRGSLPPNLPEPRLRLRSQHSLMLVHAPPGDSTRWSLEEVVERKHSMRVLLAERVKGELVRLAEERGLEAEAAVLEGWDDRVAPGSTGAVLFERWWDLYTDRVRDLRRSMPDETSRAMDPQGFAVPWDPEEPMRSPRGLAHHDLAADALREASAEVTRRWGGLDVAWGEVHRVRRGEVDLPAGGGGGDLGCFRVLSYRTDPDGRRAADRGDGWVLAVEFTDPPRAFSILAYGQSSRPDSPHFDDQASLFARGEMKRVLFEETSVREGTLRRYHPGGPDLGPVLPD